MPSTLDHRNEPTECPLCGEIFNVRDYQGSKPVDDRQLQILVCEFCGHLMAVDTSLQPRELDDIELRVIEMDQDVIRARARIARKKH